jgi:hypothetical protein
MGSMGTLASTALPVRSQIVGGRRREGNRLDRHPQLLGPDPEGQVEAAPRVELGLVLVANDVSLNHVDDVLGHIGRHVA